MRSAHVEQSEAQAQTCHPDYKQPVKNACPQSALGMHMRTEQKKSSECWGVWVCAHAHQAGKKRCILIPRGIRSQEPLTPSMGAMSRSYRARSGGLASEFCLLGREEVPSLLGDTVPLNKLVMLWQLLGRQDQGWNQAHPPSFWLPAGPLSMPVTSSSCLSLAGGTVIQH